MQFTATVAMTEVTRYITVSGAPMYVVMDGADVAYVLDPRKVVIDYRRESGDDEFEPFKATLTGYRQGTESPGDDDLVSAWQMLGVFESEETPQWLRDLAEQFRPTSWGL